MSFFDRLKANRKFFPSITEFDLLYSEYQTLDPPVPDKLPDGSPNPDKAFLENIKARRDSPSLPREENFSWDDIYKFDLMLMKYRSFAALCRKVIAERERFSNIFGKDKLNEYLKTNPLDPAKATLADIETLRADARYLLQENYQPFAVMRSREGLGKWLTYWAGVIFVVIIIIAVFLLLLPIFGVTGTPIKVAFIAGAIGGLISIFQRLQSIPSEGDLIYSLAAFWYGSYARYVSTLTGAIFGVLLYLLFTGGILQGRFFPSIATPTGADTGECGEMRIYNSQEPTPLPSPSPSPAATPKNSNGATSNTTGNTKENAKTGTGNTSANDNTAGNKNDNANGNTSAGNTSAGNGNKSGNIDTTSASAKNTDTTNTTTNTSTANANTSNANSTTAKGEPAKIGNSGLKRFLNCSGPESGFDYALLIIWCFIAGFAERLVPDTLNRLVDENDPAKKT